MPPQLAAFFCVFLILYLFWIDYRSSRGSSKALWIPLIWMFLAGSRYVSQWLKVDTPIESADPYLEGSLLDASIFLTLIIAGMLILLWRRINWSKLFTQNPWIWLFFIFCATSILWSDYPFVSFKRWIKAFGNMIMALVILTDEHPAEAIGVVLRRLAFLFLPLSVLFIKYYPDLGRAYHMGHPMFTGAALQKNSLGQLCLISGVYFCWNLLFNRLKGIESGQKLHFSIYLLVLPMTAWLLFMSNSATSITCMFIALAFLVIGRTPAVALNPRGMIYGLAILSIVFFGTLQIFFDFQGAVLDILNREETLTTRVPMWQGLLAQVKNPILGVGYEMFWDEEQRAKYHVIQAHNGYIEVYLNNGIVGLGLILITIIAGFRKALNHLDREYAYAMIRISFILVVIFYNWAEATFKPVSNLFILFLIGILEVTGRKNDEEEQEALP